ncbi:MAG: insulinase family protein [Prevotellaceae bacterium]|nr:insulinase family protein [Prevotellaceae bacterium]
MNNKYLLRGLWMLFMSLYCGVLQLAAQQSPAIPIDPQVRIGHLDNGLTYYIRHNELPARRADFYIAQKVGSIQEEPRQRGLAHFLEHICFNGTTHFPGDAVKQYLERIGVKFGENLNAYTSIDETVYNINNVPVQVEGAVDSCLLILHDWSHDLLLDPEEIDKERGVINEEWRTRNDAMQRLYEAVLPTVYAGTKYEDCMPIGNMEVVMHFPCQDLRDYYEKWYRPDLQGIIVVGDVDVDEVEAKIQTMFADIPAQPNAAERVYFPVDDNEAPIAAIATDKEQPYLQFIYFHKIDATPREQKTDLLYLVKCYITQLVSNMLDSRLDELLQVAEPPFLEAESWIGSFFVSQTKDAFSGYVMCKEEAPGESVRAFLREVERARRFGFTQGEYDRARAELQRRLESAYNERDKRKNTEYVDDYVRHFLDNEPIPGALNEYELYNEIAPSIPLELVNQYMQESLGEGNEVLVLFAPEKEGLVLPDEAELLQMLAQSKAEELTPYVDQVSDEPLMSGVPQGGEIISETTDSRFGTTELTLSNGVKVLLKPTDFKADEILMKATSRGGTSLFPDSLLVDMGELGAVRAGGLGHFSAVELDKALAGKKASVSYAVSDLKESVNGNCSPKDFETMMQLTYLTFTAPRRDDEAFSSYKNRRIAYLRNQEMDPSTALSDSIIAAVYMNHPRALRVKADELERLDYDNILSMYRQLYEDASGFTFIFVGNIDVESMKPLIAAYLGALPSTRSGMTFRDNNLRKRAGDYQNIFYKEQETPKASNLVYYYADTPYTLKNTLLSNILSQILTIVYTEKVREDEGGTYGVGCYPMSAKYPLEQSSLQIFFETAPEKRDKLMEIVYAELQHLVEAGPREEDLNKVKEFMLKSHAESLKENSYWLNCIDEYCYTGMDKLDGFEALVNGITGEEIRQFTATLLAAGNHIELSMVSADKE